MRRHRLGQAIEARKRRRLDGHADGTAPRAALPVTHALHAVAGLLGARPLMCFVAAAPACNRVALALSNAHLCITLATRRAPVCVRHGAVARQVAQLTLAYSARSRPSVENDTFNPFTLAGARHADAPGASHAMVTLDDATTGMSQMHALIAAASTAEATLDLRVVPRLHHLYGFDAYFHFKDAEQQARPLTQTASLRVLACQRVSTSAWNVLCAQPRAWTNLSLNSTHVTQTLHRIGAAMPHLTQLTLCLSADPIVQDAVNANVSALAEQLVSLTLTGLQHDAANHALATFVRERLSAFTRLTTLRITRPVNALGVTSDVLASALRSLTVLRKLYVIGRMDSLAFLTSCAPTVRALSLVQTRAPASVENVLVLHGLAHARHMKLKLAFDRGLSALELLPFQLPLRARVLPALLTFTCT